jgi:hypothetical protein
METTQVYLHASLELREEALAKMSRSKDDCAATVRQTKS